MCVRVCTYVYVRAYACVCVCTCVSVRLDRSREDVSPDGECGSPVVTVRTEGVPVETRRSRPSIGL